MMEEEKKPKTPEDILGSPQQEFYLEIDEVGAGVERFYFWILNFLQVGQPSGVKCDKVWKIKDIYTATETSSYWGSIEQRKGLQQDRVSQYLATIGKMMKDLFQIIRELRIMDERFEYYKGGDDNEVALKSIWIDMVEGGAKNPTSVLGLATQVGFTILPDLFFSIHPRPTKDLPASTAVEIEMKKLEEQHYNRKITEVLGRKLIQYLLWKEKTGKEIEQRRKFMLKYLRQHYNVIKMYMDWTRPYLRNLRRLQMKQDFEDPHLVAAFESSKVELELLGAWETKTKEELNQYQPYIRVEFTYVTIPQMAYQQEYQRGAIHVGKTIIKLKAYTLEKGKIDEYKKALLDEDLELMQGVTGSIDALKDELKKYLREAEEDVYFTEDIQKVMQEAQVDEKAAKEALQQARKQKAENEVEAAIKYAQQPEKPPFFNPFKGVAGGFREMFGLQKKGEKKKKGPWKKWQEQDQKKEAQETAKGRTYTLYDIFKKAHRMTAW